MNSIQKLKILAVKLKKSNFLKLSSVYTLSNLTNAAIPFLMLPILTRYLSPEEYGLVAIFSLLLAFSFPIIGLNLLGAISRQYYDCEQHVFAKYISNCIILLFGSAVLFSILIFLFSNQISSFIQFPVNWFWAIIISCISQFFVQILLVVWQLEHKAVLYGIYQISLTLLNFTLSVFLVIGIEVGWEGRILGQTYAFLVCAVISVIVLYKKKLLVLNFNWFYIKSALNFGIPLIPHSIGAIVISMIDRLFIAKMVSLNEAGLYMVGYQIGMIIGIIQDSFNKAWVPYFFEKLKQNNILMNLKIIKITYIYFIGILLFSIIFSLLVPKILNIIVGESYINASKYVFWISLGYAFDGMYKMVTNYIFFVRKNHILAWLTFVTAALNIILNYFLIKINGAVGAAQATAISFFVSFIITWFVSSKIYKMPWSLRRSESNELSQEN